MPDPDTVTDPNLLSNWSRMFGAQSTGAIATQATADPPPAAPPAEAKTSKVESSPDATQPSGAGNKAQLEQLQLDLTRRMLGALQPGVPGVPGVAGRASPQNWGPPAATPEQFAQQRVQMGDSPVVAEAWSREVNRESGYRPGASNPGDGRDGSTSIGIGQWNGPRAQALQQFAASKGGSPNDYNTQMQYLQAEVDGVIPREISGVPADFKQRLAAAKTPEEAQTLIRNQFFRPLAGGMGLPPGHAALVQGGYGVDALNRQFAGMPLPPSYERKPVEMPETPKFNPRPPEQAIAEPLALLAVVGGLFARTASKASIKALTAAIQGQRSGDERKFKNEMETFRGEMAKATEQNRIEHEKYEEAWQARGQTMNERLATLQMLSTQYGNTALANALKAGPEQIEQQIGMLKKISDVVGGMTKTQNAYDMKAAEIDSRIKMAEARGASAAEIARLKTEGNKELEMVKQGNRLELQDKKHVDKVEELDKTWDRREQGAKMRGADRKELEDLKAQHAEERVKLIAQLKKEADGGNLPPEAEGVHGEEFIDRFVPFDKRDVVRDMIAGRVLPSDLGNRAKDRQQLIGYASHATADLPPAERFNPTNAIGARRWETIYMQGGQGGQTLSAANTALQHMATLLRLKSAVDSGDVRTANALTNYVRTQLGHPEAHNADIAAKMLGTEVAKAVRGVGALNQTEQDEAKKFDEISLSNPQMEGSVDTMRELMMGRLHTLQDMAILNHVDKSRTEGYILPHGKEANAYIDSKPLSKGGAASLPPEALSRLQEGHETTFGNGQVWTLRNGKPIKVR